VSKGNETRAKRYNAERSRVADAGARRRRSGVVDDQMLIAGVEDVRARWAEFDACFTPTPVARQLVERLKPMVRSNPRVLDPCAGSGVFGMVAADLSPCHLVAIEPRDEELLALQRWYDDVHGGNAQDVCPQLLADEQEFDLIVTNPPWWCWGEIMRHAWQLLADDGVLALLGPSTWGHSDESSEFVDVFDEMPPIEQWRVRGRIAFNGGSSTDNRKCSLWLWRMGAAADRDGWKCINLPALPVEARRWTVRPGTEDT
jgi:hypothetical protein